MFRRQELCGKINDTLAILTSSTRMRSAGGDLGANYAAEDFFCGLLNIILQKDYPGIKLENLNTRKSNYPAVDLGDEKQSIAVQVTTTEKRGKINHTLSEFFEHKLDQVFHRRMIILVIGKKDDIKSDFRILENHNYGFSHKEDVWDTDHLGREIAKADLETMEKLYAYLCQQLTLFPEQKCKLHLPVSAMDEKLFVGREDELAELARRVGERKHDPILVTGLGGMGKTELVARFCKDYRDGRVYFVRFQRSFSETVAMGMAAGLEDYGKRQPDPEQDCREVMEILGNADRRDILIIDNADEENGNFGLLKQDPVWQALRNLPLRLIVTTRCEVTGAIRVGQMDQAKLYRLFENQEIQPEPDKTQMDQLIAAVNGHTMTVDLMARTLKRSRTLTAEKLLAALESGSLPNQRVRPVELHRNGQVEQEEIYTHLKKLFNVAEIPEDARGMLRNMTLLPENGLSMEVFESILTDEGLERLEAQIDHGWLGYEENARLVTIHPVVRLVCREELKPDDENCGNFLRAVWHWYDPNRYDAVRYRQMAELFSRAADTLPDAEADWAIRAGFLWKQVGLARNALAYEVQAVKRLEETMPETKRLATAYNNVGLTYGDLGDRQKELEYGLKALAIREQVLPPQHPDLALSYNNVGSTYGALGDHQKALEFNRKALAIREQVLPPQHPDLARSYNNVGCTYGDLGDRQKELEYGLKALAIREQVLPPQHPDLASSYNNVGSTYGALGDHQKALEFKRKALAIWEQVLPPQHPDLANSYNNVGVTYANMGDSEKALEYLRRALAIWEQSLPQGHPDTQSTRENIQYIEETMKNE